MQTIRTNKVARKVDFDGYHVTITVPPENATQIDDFLSNNNGKEIEITMKRKNKKRSLTANNYFWVLCEQIAQATGGDKELIYRTIISRVGVWDFCIVRKDAVKAMKNAWSENGIGYFAEEIPLRGKVQDSAGNEITDAVQLVLYYGSSSYDSVQMARIIDNAVEECTGLGISVSKEEAKEYKESWEKDT